MTGIRSADGTDVYTNPEIVITALPSGAGPKVNIWEKIHRFIRLWHKLGWSMSDFDKTLTALGSTEITADVRQKLAQVEQLQTDSDVPIVQLLSLWADIDIWGDHSLYRKLFLNKAVLALDPVFQPYQDGSVLTGLSTSLFSAGDFMDLDGLIGKLRAHADPVSQFLWNQFSTLARQVLTDPNATEQQQRSTLVEQLNNVLRADIPHTHPLDLRIKCLIRGAQ